MAVRTLKNKVRKGYYATGKSILIQRYTGKYDTSPNAKPHDRMISFGFTKSYIKYPLNTSYNPLYVRIKGRYRVVTIETVRGDKEYWIK